MSTKSTLVLLFFRSLAVKLDFGCKLSNVRTSMSAKKRKPSEIISEMTDILAKHLETMPPEERSERIEAFSQVIRGEKHENARPKVSSSSRTAQKSHRIPA